MGQIIQFTEYYWLSLLGHFSCVRLFGWQPARLCPWDSPGKNTGVGCHFLLQGIFLTQGSNVRLSCLLHCRRILYHWAPGIVLIISRILCWRDHSEILLKLRDRKWVWYLLSMNVIPYIKGNKKKIITLKQHDPMIHGPHALLLSLVCGKTLTKG